MKIKYVNNFICQENVITGEIMLAMYADYNDYDEENKPHQKRDEIGRIMMSSYTSQLLAQALAIAVQHRKNQQPQVQSQEQPQDSQGDQNNQDNKS